MPEVTVLYEPGEDGLVTVTLNRPERLNAFNFEMLAEFESALIRAEQDDSCRVVAITGAGRAFSAGADVKMFNEGVFTAAEQLAPCFRPEARDVTAKVEGLRKPVIAAVNGVAVGEGLEIALAADFRILASSARIGFPEAKIGLIPASGGCSRIVKYVGLMRAKELFLRGGMLSAEEARAAGLATTVVPDDQLAKDTQVLAGELAAKAPLSLAMMKAVLNACADIDMHSAHLLEMVAQSVLINTEDHREGVQAFVEKREPSWVGR